MSDKNFAKINIKIVISIKQFTHVLNFNKSGETQFLKPDLAKKDFGWCIWKNSIRE